MTLRVAAKGVVSAARGDGEALWLTRNNPRVLFLRVLRVLRPNCLLRTDMRLEQLVSGANPCLPLFNGKQVSDVAVFDRAIDSAIPFSSSP